MVKIRIIPKYAQFELKNDLEKSTLKYYPIPPKSQIEIRLNPKKYQSKKKPRG